MLTVSLIFAAATIGDDAAQAARLPLARATLLRDSGCWFQWEGEVSAKAGGALFELPGSVDASTISVERAEGSEWRSMDFSIHPVSAKPASGSQESNGQASLLVSAASPSEAKSVNLRVRAFSTAMKWRPTYALGLGKDARMSMRCLANAAAAIDRDALLECIASSGTPRGGESDYWSDSTVYPLTAKRLGRGTTSLLLFDEPAAVEEFVAVELGGMVGEPGIKPAKDRSVSMLRLSNRSTKTWPTGELLVTHEGRLIARVLLPHTDSGRSSEIALGTAVGVTVSRDEVELERKTAVVRRESDPPDSVQTAGSVTVSNHRGQALVIRATKTVAGDATAASDDAKIVRTPNRLGTEQPLNEIRWNFTLPAGQSKRLTYGTIIRLPLPSETKDPRP